ncbi:MAG TPA: class I SAM-dependent methyltransferase [Acidimicrobiia bacterium]|nr:class I SAM-dependent methyltransferase [Acidimicrobiia bacterium]
MTNVDRCPSCGASGLRHFHRQDSIPVNSVLLLDSRDDAVRFPRGDLRLAFCDACGFITNTAFDRTMSEYSTRYEETQGFSPRFQEFARSLAKRWVDTYDLAGRTVVEIGCGKGEFLTLLCEYGVGRGIGIDPSYRPDRLDTAVADRLEFIQDFYSEQYGHLAGDAIVCRHTLEHIQPVRSFMETVRRSIGDRTDTVVLFELPDVRRVLEEVAFWDVYYEHCSYFSLGSLARLFRRTGFDVLDLSLEYDDQYLLVEAKPGDGTGTPMRPEEDDLGEIAMAVDHFEAHYGDTVERWRDQVAGYVQEGRRVVIWGGGSKGVAYFTTLGVDDHIEYAVDINPYKQGKYMAGTGQEVVAPEFLKEYRPDLVVVMNAIYRDEIQQSLDAMGVSADVVAV